ncbi:MAG: glucosaminidase domain-containing protein [Nanoarchaeota archaeon]|nr:glucosaminidase domain-containing protein [Nanoarchaeota archaeon]
MEERIKRRGFMKRIVGGGVASLILPPSKAYGNANVEEFPELTTTSQLNRYIPIDYDNAENFLKQHGHFQRLENLLPIFTRAGEDFQLDTRYLIGHFSEETGYGQSGEWKNRHNGFGIGSFDHNSNNAFVFESPEDGIYRGAQWIAENYIHNRRNTTTLDEMHAVPYATNPRWASNIAWIGRKFS